MMRLNQSVRQATQGSARCSASVKRTFPHSARPRSVRWKMRILLPGVSIGIRWARIVGRVRSFPWFVGIILALARRLNAPHAIVCHLDSVFVLCLVVFLHYRSLFLLLLFSFHSLFMTIKLQRQPESTPFGGIMRSIPRRPPLVVGRVLVEEGDHGRAHVIRSASSRISNLRQT
jgi:hypothetical protein